MKIFNLESIKPSDIYRVYIEENSLVILTTHNRKTVYENLDNEEMENLIQELKNKCLKERYNLEVYNGFNETKSH